MGTESLPLIKIMNTQAVVGTTLVFSTPIINTTASAIGIAKTGTAIGTLHGAAHASATAAWIGLGSMKVGMFMMGAFPVVGALLLLDSIGGQDHGSPMIDWYEESWRQYEIRCELEELKKQVTVDPDHQIRAKSISATLAQQDYQFRALEVEHELYSMKKQMGIQNNKCKKEIARPSVQSLVELDCKYFSDLKMPNLGLKVKINATGVIGFIVSEFLHTKWNTHRLEIKPVNSSYTTYVSFSEVSLVTESE